MNASELDPDEPLDEHHDSGLGRMLAAADGIRDKAERQARALNSIRILAEQAAAVTWRSLDSSNVDEANGMNRVGDDVLGILEAHDLLDGQATS